MVKDREPFEKVQQLLEEFINHSNSCLGDKCPQYNQLKVKQNLFMSIAAVLVVTLIGISTMAHVELGSFKEHIHVAEITSVSKEADLSRQVQDLNEDVSELYGYTKSNCSQLNKLKIDIERIKVVLK